MSKYLHSGIRLSFWNFCICDFGINTLGEILGHCLRFFSLSFGSLLPLVNILCTCCTFCSCFTLHGHFILFFLLFIFQFCNLLFPNIFKVMGSSTMFNLLIRIPETLFPLHFFKFLSFSFDSLLKIYLEGRVKERSSI